MYLVGDNSELRSDHPFDETRMKESLTKQDLIKAKQNKDFNIINLEKMEYFNPEKNEWVKLKPYGSL